MSNITSDRRARINRLKKIIVITNFSIIFVLLLLCILLSMRVCSMGREIDSLEDELRDAKNNMAEDEKETLEDIGQENESVGHLSEDDTEINPEEMYEKIAYLTFDDGPSGSTYEILDILDEYNVKATFFMTGKDVETWNDEYAAIAQRGHSIGMHSYNHVFSEVYASLDSFSKDLTRIREFLKEKTGIDTILYRFPGGSSTTKTTNMQTYIDYLNENGYKYFDWNVSSGDATAVKLSAETIVENVMNGAKGQNHIIVLMHDSSLNKTTIEALPTIIENLKNEGYILLPIVETTTPVHHIIN